jgi:hypothetical protein
VGILRRSPDPQQQSWIALQRQIAETLKSRLVERGGSVANEQEADWLADHITDDLMRIEPLVPPEHWVDRNAR